MSGNIPSPFTMSQSAIDEYKRAHARDTQVYYDIGHRHTQQMRHGDWVARMGGSGGGGTLRRMGQDIQQRATLGAGINLLKHQQQESDIARALANQRERQQWQKHDLGIKQIKKNRGTDAHVAQRERAFQARRRRQQQADATQAEALRRHRLGDQGRKREDRDAILDEIRKKGETPELLRALRAVNPTHFDMWAAPPKRGNRLQSRSGVPVTRFRWSKPPKSSMRKERDTRTAEEVHADMIKSATQPRRSPPVPPSAVKAAAPAASVGGDIDDDAGGWLGQGDVGYASLGEDDDDEEGGGGGGGGDGTPIQPARTLSPKRGIVVHARPKGRNTPTTRTSRRREAAAATARARRRTHSGIGSGGIVVHSSKPSPAARDALRAKVEGNLGQVSAAPAKKKMAWIMGRTSPKNAQT